MVLLATIPSLSFSSALPIDTDSLNSESLGNLTFTCGIDELVHYNNINEKLLALETSLDINKEGLDHLLFQASQFLVAYEEKEDVLLRLDWLQRLYKAKAELCSVNNKEKIKHFRILIAPVQTCPLKTQLLAELSSLEDSLPVEETINVQPAEFELLMEMAINESGVEFINMGKAGREYVIAEVMKHEGNIATTAHVKALAGQLEGRVFNLSEVSNRTEMIAVLDQLPLSVFSSLHDVKKERVAEVLIQEKGWTGLFSLERRISQISKAIDREEREKYESENVIDLPDGKAAATLDLRYNSID